MRFNQITGEKEMKKFVLSLMLGLFLFNAPAFAQYDNWVVYGVDKSEDGKYYSVDLMPSSDKEVETIVTVSESDMEIVLSDLEITHPSQLIGRTIENDLYEAVFGSSTDMRRVIKPQYSNLSLELKNSLARMECPDFSGRDDSLVNEEFLSAFRQVKNPDIPWFTNLSSELREQTQGMVNLELTREYLQNRSTAVIQVFGYGKKITVTLKQERPNFQCSLDQG